MNELVKKRIVRVLPLTTSLIVVFNLMAQKGYWLDTTKAVVNFGLPAFLGSVWFNLLTDVFVVLAVILASNKNFEYGFRGFLAAATVSISVFSIVFGLAIGFSLVFLILLAICAIGIPTFLLNNTYLKKALGKVFDFFWPNE